MTTDTPVLIFDLDGTLIDSAPDIHAGANEMLRAQSLPPITLAETIGFIGRGVPALVAQILDHHGQPQDPTRIARMVAHFETLYETALGLTRLYPNARTTLEALKRQGYTLALCTNKPEKPTRAVLDHFELTGLFTAATYGDGPYPRKPNPAPVQHILNQLGTTQALYIGDSETDAATARNAALPFALFTRGYRKSAPQDIPHHASFDDFAQLPQIIARRAPSSC